MMMRMSRTAPPPIYMEAFVPVSERCQTNWARISSSALKSNS
jgi:hypothetical protein